LKIRPKFGKDALERKIWISATALSDDDVTNKLEFDRRKLQNLKYSQYRRFNKEAKLLIILISLSKLNSVARVRERTISNERPPLVGKVSANFCG
jgi:hypothetical protein